MGKNVLLGTIVPYKSMLLLDGDVRMEIEIDMHSSLLEECFDALLLVNFVVRPLGRW